MLIPLVALATLLAPPALAQGMDEPRAGLVLGGLMAVAAVAAAVALVVQARRLRRRDLQLHARNAHLAAANAELRQVTERAEAKARMLDGVLAAMADGILVVDAELRLAGWNPRFPDYAGVPRRALRIGMPLREVIRLQAEAGEFGMVDPEAETERRMKMFHDGTVPQRLQRERPDGSRLELRRTPLPGGGYVTLYTPILATPSAAGGDALQAAFRQEWARRIPRLTAAAADGDAAEARAVAHALRGVAANAGWAKAAHMMEGIEEAAAAGALTQLRMLAAGLPQDPAAWN
ncbi:PAS domain-containing protein [Falsiroseomonas ponticola]|jgi:PAS domain-containing protein|uniref:PAS domain-containing protein n=1 Tax=Falsiroseomonas ponticola TaxID=2786951 RepID=UPI0019339EDF|nr:PAS-domain containing protein [Roseomonas ponticola]